MKLPFYAIAVAATAMITGGCATTNVAVGGLETEKLVRYNCEGKDFSARAAEDYLSVRVRTPEGSVNLDRAEGNEFKGEGWTLKTTNGLALVHKDKVVSHNCKKEA